MWFDLLLLLCLRIILRVILREFLKVVFSWLNWLFFLVFRILIFRFVVLLVILWLKLFVVEDFIVGLSFLRFCLRWLVMKEISIWMRFKKVLWLLWLRFVKIILRFWNGSKMVSGCLIFFFLNLLRLLRVFC